MQTATSPRGTGHVPESGEVQASMWSRQINLAGRVGVGLQKDDQVREQFKTRPGSGQCSEVGACLVGRGKASSSQP